MAHVLPKVDHGKKLDFEWFPTPAQCVIYRNYGTVPFEKLAKVLKTDVETVLEMASDMGLDTNITVSKEWNIRGYITIIRNNWHLLDYDAICELLGWTPKYLAYMLKEDDFLEVKLGMFKPETPDISVRSLTEDEIRRTKQIKEITLEANRTLPAITEKSFDFFGKNYGKKPASDTKGGEIFKERIIYSYCALYGDTFFSRETVDMSFPDDMLEKYQAVGVNGIWTQAVLSQLAPYPFGETVTNDYKTRLAGVRYLTDKLERYGIKLYLYFNEPRAVSDSFFEKHPELMGHTDHSRERFVGFHTLCMSTEPVRKYLYDSVAFVVKNIPKLGGLYTITASENLTHCHSHTKNKVTSCPRCKDKSRAELIALVNKTICEGALSANPNLKVIAHSWAWAQPEFVAEVEKGLPKEMGISIVSEFDVRKNIKGVNTKVIDYSISMEGPGDAARAVWKFTKEKGRDAYAKVQVNNTWELCTIPFIPVFDKVYGHLCRIAQTGDVNGLFLSWTLGGYPSPMLEMVSEFKNDKIPTLEELYQKIFPTHDTNVLAKAFTAMSKAFDIFPFSVTVIYDGPMQMGPANLLYREKTGFNATMVCYPYDDLTTWRHIYPENIFFECFDELCKGWKEGLDILDTLDMSNDPKLSFVRDCAEGCLMHFSSARNQVRYLMEGTDIAAKKEVLESETEVARRMIALCARNAAFGFEAADHYYYTRQNLLEKIINCKYLEGIIKE